MASLPGRPTPRCMTYFALPLTWNVQNELAPPRSRRSTSTFEPFLIQFSLMVQPPFTHRDTHTAHSSVSSCRTSGNTASGEQPAFDKELHPFHIFFFFFFSPTHCAAAAARRHDCCFFDYCSAAAAASDNVKVDKDCEGTVWHQTPRDINDALESPARSTTTFHVSRNIIPKNLQTELFVLLCLLKKRHGNSLSAPTPTTGPDVSDTVKWNSFSTPAPARHSSTSSNTTKSRIIAAISNTLWKKSRHVAASIHPGDWKQPWQQPRQWVLPSERKPKWQRRRNDRAEPKTRQSHGRWQSASHPAKNAPSANQSRSAGPTSSHPRRQEPKPCTPQGVNWSWAKMATECCCRCCWIVILF